MDPETRVREHFAESVASKQTAAQQLVESIVAAGRAMSDALLDDGKILSCGNGGSAADAQHFSRLLGIHCLCDLIDTTLLGGA